MASEVDRMPNVSACLSANEQVLYPGDFQVPSGLDVPRHHSDFSYCASKSSFQPDYCCRSSTTPNLWSDADLSPVVGSSGCSTETDSNEDDEFMAGLAEQMTHFMLGNEEEEEFSVVETPSLSDSNWTPVSINPVAFDTEQNPRWNSGGCHGSCCSSVDNGHLSPISALPSPTTVKENSFDRLRYAVASEAIYPQAETFRDDVSNYNLKQENDQAVSRKIEEFLWKQALKRSYPNALPLKDSSILRSDFPAGTYLSGGSRPKNSSMYRSQRSKFREDDRRTFSNQGRHARQGTFPSWGRHCRLQQQASNPLHCRSSVQSRNNDQRAARMPESSLSRQVSPNFNGNSNMRAVFLSGNANRRESAGTGVFLPRCAGVSSDSYRKPACSTVLLPSRIVQVLNIQVDDLTTRKYCEPPYVCSASPGTSMSSSKASVSGTMEVYQQNHVKAYLSSHIHPPSQEFELSQGEFNLPIDWTY